MNQSRAFIVSIVVASVGMLLVYYYIESSESRIKAKYGNEVTVLVANEDVNENVRLQDDMLTLVAVPKTFLQPSAIVIDSEQSNQELANVPEIERSVLGLYTAAPIKKGEQILKTKLLKGGAEVGLAQQVAITKRALSIPVRMDTAVSKLIKPGDHVDLISAIVYSTEDGPFTETKTILQNVRILAVGELVQNQIPSIEEEDPITGNTIARNLRGDTTYETVTIELSPEESQTIIHILADDSKSSDLYITLRNPVDRLVSEVSTTTVDEVLGPNSKKAIAERLRNRPKPQPVKRAPAKVKRPKSLSSGGLLE